MKVFTTEVKCTVIEIRKGNGRRDPCPGMGCVRG